MYKIIILSIFFLLKSNPTFCQQQDNSSFSNEKVIAFSILSREGPSWVYKLTTKLKIEIEFQTRKIDNTLLRSDKFTVENVFTSKFDVSNLSDSDFYVVILNGENEIYREKNIAK